ncbi:MAG: PP2C family serine/threonine-protein phosphatase [Fimbriimonadaceae bacterium]
MTQRAAPWRYAAVSVQGTAHHRDGTPCQDYGLVDVVPAPYDGQVLIAVAADGAGSAVNAGLGAIRTCEAFASFQRLKVPWSPFQFVPDIADAIVRDVIDHIEEEAAGMSEDASAFACTLLGCVIQDDLALFVQVGDGAMVYRVDPDPEWKLALPSHRGEFVGETVFVTSPDARRQMRVRTVEQPISEIALMTDGVEFLAIRQATATPHAPFLEHVMRGLRLERQAGYSLDHHRFLEEFLASAGVCERTDDDKTLILASRRAMG